MSDLPTHPDALWAVLKTLCQPGRPALSYQEIASVVDLAVPTVGQHVTTIVDHEWATLDRHGRYYRVTVTVAGAAASVDRAKLPTVQAVIAEARRITREEHAQAERDPYYTKPYIPSDDTARKLSQQLGPDRAIATLRHRQAERRHRHAENTEISERSELRRERRARVTHRDRQAARASLSLGQRLDRALVALATAQSAPAARLDAEPITDGGGGKDDANPVPKLHDDTLGWAERRVTKLLRELEDTVDSQQRRVFEFERQAIAS